MNGLSKYYIKKIINCFAAEMTATETSRKLKINRNTVNKYYRIIREAIVDYQELQLQYNLQSVPKNRPKHYFSWHKNIGLIYDLESGDAVFSMTVKNNRVFVEEVNAADLQGIITHPDSLGYDAPTSSVSEEGEDKEEEENLFRIATTTAESFFVYAKDKLTKFYGVKKEYTYLYLKELEFRFNNNGKDLAKTIWRILPHHSNIWKKASNKRSKS